MQSGMRVWAMKRVVVEVSVELFVTQESENEGLKCRNPLDCVAQSIDCASPWRRGTYTYMHIRRYQIANSDKAAVHSAHSQVQHRECVQIVMPELHIHLHDSSECTTVSLSACCMPLLVQVVNDEQNACTVNSLVTSDTPTMTVTPTIAMYNCE